MGKFELKQYQITQADFKYEPYFFEQCPLQVVARSLLGNDYFKDQPTLKWNGMHKVIHVVAAIFMIANCENGTESLDSKIRR